MNPQIHRSNGTVILYDADRFAQPDDLPFIAEDTIGPVRVEGSGRGGTWRIRFDETVAALRNYRRGGLARHFLTSAYLWTGLERTRAFREFRLLADLHVKGLPVPAPLAAQVVRVGFWYRATLLTEWLPGTHSLVDMLGRQEQDAALWACVGRTIKSFHTAGIDHSDLNADNILIDATQRVYLIDFDRGCYRPRPGLWRNSNLARLKRSLEKMHATGRALYYSRAGWDALMAAYRG